MIDFDVQILPAAEVAKMFGTTAPKVKAAILNGTLPIGFVAEKRSEKEVDRIFIVKKRLEAWLNASDLKLSSEVALK